MRQAAGHLGESLSQLEANVALLEQDLAQCRAESSDSTQRWKAYADELREQIKELNAGA
jgi:hypothetical protein